MQNSLAMNTIELEISNPCNERCVHCYRVCENTKRGFLSARQAQSVLEQAKAIGADKVTITGGEPLLNPEWRDIVSAAEKLDFLISFFSNGSLLKEADADFLATVKNLNGVQFSLYALDERTHDAITGVSGSCAGTKNAISLLRERQIPLFVSCPVMKENKSAVLAVMRWCDSEGINSCADIFIFGDSDYTGKNLSHRLSWSEIRDFFEETMKDGGRLSYVWGSGHGERDLRKIEFYGGAARSLCVSGDGTIYPAIGWYEPLGNIATDSIKDVFYNSPILQKLRGIKASDISECARCGCVDFCTFCFTPHISANHGKLGKVDKDGYCKFVALRKKLAYERDARLGKVAE